MQTLKKKNEEKIGGGPKKKKKVEGDQRKKVGYGKGEVGEKLSGKVWLAIRSTSAIGSKKQRNAERKNMASHTKYLGNTKKTGTGKDKLLCRQDTSSLRARRTSCTLVQ